MPQICDMGKRLYFPSEGRHAEDFFAQKIRRLRPGVSLRSWVQEASMLTTRPPKPLLWTCTQVQIWAEALWFPLGLTSRCLMFWQIECTTQVSTDTPLISLTPLMRLDENYRVQVSNDTVVYINVCRPLLPVKGLSCFGGSSACIASLHNGNLIDEKVQCLYPDSVKLHMYMKGNLGWKMTVYQNDCQELYLFAGTTLQVETNELWKPVRRIGCILGTCR
jgi:hypothetical protein